MAEKLVRNKEKMPTDGLIVEWRPLYRLLDTVLFPKGRDMIYSSVYSMLSPIVKLFVACRRFFRPTSAMEILEECLPKINVHNLLEMTARSFLLTGFLQTSSVPTKPEGHTGKPFFWVPLMFSLWDMVIGEPPFDSLFIELFGRLAKDQITTPANLEFNHAQIRKLYAVGIKNMSLPIKNAPLRHFQMINFYGPWKNASQNFANFIIYSIQPEGEIMDQFISLVQILEGFAHPSNSGSWTYSIVNLVCKMSENLLERMNLENADDSKVPSSIRIPKETYEKLAKKLMGLVILFIFAKDANVANVAFHALLYLSWVDPNSVFPILLPHVYSSLESSTQAHRTNTCIVAAARVAYPLFLKSHYPFGLQHLMPLLCLVLPGLDANDLTKSKATLFFVSIAVSCVPLIETEVACELDIISNYQIETWLAQFLESIFRFFSNLPKNFGVLKNGSEEAEVLRRLEVRPF